MCVTENTLRGTIVGKKHDIGDYTTYVFDVGGEEPYVMCTELPGWNLGPLDIGTEGFFKFREVAAGDEYVTKDGELCRYKHDGVYLLEFIKDNKSHGRIEDRETSERCRATEEQRSCDAGGGTEVSSGGPFKPRRTRRKRSPDLDGTPN